MLGPDVPAVSTNSLKVWSSTRERTAEKEKRTEARASIAPCHPERLNRCREIDPATVATRLIRFLRSISPSREVVVGTVTPAATDDPVFSRRQERRTGPDRCELCFAESRDHPLARRPGGVVRTLRAVARRSWPLGRREPSGAACEQPPAGFADRIEAALPGDLWSPNLMRPPEAPSVASGLCDQREKPYKGPRGASIAGWDRFSGTPKKGAKNHLLGPFRAEKRPQDAGPEGALGPKLLPTAPSAPPGCPRWWGAPGSRPPRSRSGRSRPCRSRRWPGAGAAGWGARRR